MRESMRSAQYWKREQEVIEYLETLGDRVEIFWNRQSISIYAVQFKHPEDHLAFMLKFDTDEWKYGTD